MSHPGSGEASGEMPRTGAQPPVPAGSTASNRTTWIIAAIVAVLVVVAAVVVGMELFGGDHENGETTSASTSSAARASSAPATSSVTPTATPTSTPATGVPQTLSAEERVYVFGLERAGITFDSPGEAIVTGRRVCNEFESGAAIEHVVDKARNGQIAIGKNLTEPQAVALIAASVKLFCAGQSSHLGASPTR